MQALPSLATLIVSFVMPFVVSVLVLPLFIEEEIPPGGYRPRIFWSWVFYVAAGIVIIATNWWFEMKTTGSLFIAITWAFFLIGFFVGATKSNAAAHHPPRHQ